MVCWLDYSEHMKIGHPWDKPGVSLFLRCPFRISGCELLLEKVIFDHAGMKCSYFTGFSHIDNILAMHKFHCILVHV
jgi:hypothetical protein